MVISNPEKVSLTLFARQFTRDAKLELVRASLEHTITLM